MVFRSTVGGSLFRGPTGGVQRVFGGCDLGQVGAFAADGALRSWDCQDRRPVTEIRLSSAQILDLAVDPTLTRAAHVDEHGGVWLTELAGGEPRRIGVHPRLGSRVAFSHSAYADHSAEALRDRRRATWRSKSPPRAPSPLPPRAHPS